MTDYTLPPHLEGIPILPAQGDGCIWSGSEWLHVAPTMESHAVVMFSRKVRILEEEIDAYRTLMTRFCERVDAGEIKSQTTYNNFKQALEKYK